MEMTSLPSSAAVRAVGYDEAGHVMRVAFRSGGVYDYYDVDADLYEEMFRPHPWTRLRETVMAHRFRRVPE